MGTLADKLAYLGATKTELREALNTHLRTTLETGTPFRQYAGHIPEAVAQVSAPSVSFDENGYAFVGLDTPEQELVLIREVYDTAGGALFVSDDANQFEDSAGNIAASVNGVMGCWLDSSQSGTVQGRRNLLTYSEDFRNTANAGETRPWTYLEGLVDYADGWNRVYAADGGSTTPYVQQAATITGTSASLQFECKRTGTENKVIFALIGTGIGPSAVTSSIYSYDFSTDILANESGASVSAISREIIATNHVRIKASWIIATVTFVRFYPRRGTTAATDGTSISKVQIEPGQEPTPYQKIITGTADLVPGAHAFQNVTANKPYKRRTPSTGLNWADSNTATAALNVTFNTALGSACTVARVGPDGVTFLENQTIGTSYNIAPAYGWNGDVAIIDRPLTATEKALFTRYMLRHKPETGPELVVNGDFSNGLTGWENTSGLYSVIGGQVVKSATGDAYLTQYVTNPAPGQYFGAVDILSYTASPALQLGSVNVSVQTFSVSTRKQCVSIFISSLPRRVGLYGNAALITADNFSFKEIL